MRDNAITSMVVGSQIPLTLGKRFAQETPQTDPSRLLPFSDSSKSEARQAPTQRIRIGASGQDSPPNQNNEAPKSRASRFRNFRLKLTSNRLFVPISAVLLSGLLGVGLGGYANGNKIRLQNPFAMTPAAEKQMPQSIEREEHQPTQSAAQIQQEMIEASNAVVAVSPAQLVVVPAPVGQAQEILKVQPQRQRVAAPELTRPIDPQAQASSRQVMTAPVQKPIDQVAKPIAKQESAQDEKPKVAAMVLDESTSSVAASRAAAQAPIQPAPARQQSALLAAASNAIGQKLIVIAPDGKTAIFSNPKTRYPEQYRIGDRLPNGDVLKSINAASGKVITTEMEYRLD